MDKICLNCGYQRRPEDDAPEWCCPRCAVVYAKAEARKQRQEALAQQAQAAAAISAQASSEAAPRRPWWRPVLLYLALPLTVTALLVFAVHQAPVSLPQHVQFAHHPLPPVEPPLPLPATGPLNTCPTGPISFTVRTQGTSVTDPELPAWHHVIKLQELGCLFFLRAGEKLHVSVPPGVFHLKYAVGTTWQGPERLFGADTQFHEAEQILEFRVGYFYEVELIHQFGGNLPTSRIPAAAW